MKKALSRVLLTLNVLLILLMLLLSGVMVYMTASKPAEIFGYSAVLVTDEDAGGILCIVNRHPVNLLPMDTVLYRTDEQELLLLTVDRNDGSSIYYLDEKGKPAPISLQDKHLEGEVTSEHPLWGQFFAVIASEENARTTYICIGIGFLFCVVAIALVYFLTAKLSTPLVENEEDLLILRELLGSEVVDAVLENAGEEDEDASEEGGLSNSAGPFPQLANLLNRRSKEPVEIPPEPAPEAEAPPPPPSKPLEAIPIDVDETVEVKIYTPQFRKKTTTEPPEKTASSVDIDKLLKEIEDEFKDIKD